MRRVIAIANQKGGVAYEKYVIMQSGAHTLLII